MKVAISYGQRMVGDADRLEDYEKWNNLVKPMLEVVHRSALVHSTMEPDGPSLLKLRMGDFVTPIGPEVWHNHHQHRQQVEHGISLSKHHVFEFVGDSWCMARNGN